MFETAKKTFYQAKKKIDTWLGRTGVTKKPADFSFPETKGVTSPAAVSLKKDKENKRMKAFEYGAAGGAIGATAAETVAVGIKTATAAPLGFDKMQSNFINVNRDVPINETAIPLVHNAGGIAGEGTPFAWANSNISIEDGLKLGLGFEFDLWEENGQMVVRHGPFTDPFSPGAISFQERLKPIAQWLDNPANEKQVVFIQLEDNMPNRYWDKSLLEGTFGDKLFTRSEFNEFYALHGRWPTANELTEGGNNVVIFSDNWHIGDYGFTLGSHPEMQQIWEDRAWESVFGYGVVDGVATEIDTDKFDTLVQQGGILKLDALSQNDPRLYAPEHRDELVFRPDITTGGADNALIPLGHNDAFNKLFFVGGVGLAVAGGSFGTAASVYSAYQNYQFLKSLDTNLIIQLQQLQLEDIKQQKDHALIDNGLIKSHLKNEIIGTISKSVLLSGSIGTLSIAGAFFSLGLLFPVAFPVLSGLAIATLAIGALVTIAATVWHRRYLDKKIDAELEKLDNLISKKTQELNSEEKATTPLSQIQKRHEKATIGNLGKASMALFATTLVLRIGNMAKYAFSLIGVVAGVALSAVYAVWATINAVLNFKERQLRLTNMAKTISDAMIPDIHEKRFVFFGSTPLTRYIKANQDSLAKEIAVSTKPQLSVNDIHKILLQNTYLRNKHQQKLVKTLLENDLEKYMKNEAKYRYQRFTLIKKNSVSLKDLINDFFVDKIKRAAFSDTFKAGFFNTLKITVAIGVIGMLFPPATTFIIAGAAAILLVGTIVSAIVATIEQNRFAKQAHEMINSQVNPTNLLSSKQHQAMDNIKQGLVALLLDNNNLDVSDQQPRAPNAQAPLQTVAYSELNARAAAEKSTYPNNAEAAAKKSTYPNNAEAAAEKAPPPKKLFDGKIKR